LPLWLLQNQKLDPAADLAAAHVPRLFLEVHGKPIVGPMGSESTRTRSLFEASSYPKQYVDLRALSDSGPDSAFAKMLRRFFDDTLPQSP
jgi:hypothetical protein